MEFNIDEAIKTANHLLKSKFNKNLTDIEIVILKGSWQREDYDMIAAKHQYATTYISQDVAPKLWKMLTDALGEKVKKTNFKEALKRYWENHILTANTNTESNNSSPQFAHTDNLNFYVERPPIESVCYEHIMQPGSLLRIKAPSLMGKTYLMTRVLNQLANQGYDTVQLTFKLADKSIHFTNLNKFLRWFCINISKELKIPHELDEYWDEEGMGSKVSCTTYFEEYLLTQSENPLVVCLDDVDLIFPYPEISEDFFGLLRSWYEKARSRKLWQKLRLVILHSTDVYIQLNINQSPFNVGLPIELPEFTKEQILEFVQKYGLALEQNFLESLIALVGGHLYLLELAFTHLKGHPEVKLEEILAAAPTEAGIYRNYLWEHWLNLQQHPQLAASFQQVIAADDFIQIEPLSAYQLHSMGLVKLSGNKVQPRCDLYRQYFGTRLSNIEEVGTVE
jgi:hypothetical protein